MPRTSVSRYLPGRPSQQSGPFPCPSPDRPVDIGQQPQEISPELEGEQSTRAVLVDDRLDTDQSIAAAVHHRNVSTSDANDDASALGKQLDGTKL